MSNSLNGIDVSRLMSQIDLVRQNPSLGDFTFSSTTKWQGGLKADHTLTDLRFGGEKLHHKQSHVLHSDMPESISGEDTGACPLEMLIASLGACLLTGYVAHAAAMNVHLQELTIDITGEGDLAGFFGVGAGKSGITNIHVKTTVKATAPNERLHDLHRFVSSHSPVWDTLTSRVIIDSKLFTGEEEAEDLSL
jgi:uncharacterized OsmC-like protein